MLPTALAPLDPHKTRALTTIYAPRKLTTRKNKTAQTRMLDNNIPVKPTLSPFQTLPAIGQKLQRSKTKIIVFDLNKNEPLDRSVKIHDVLQPLTPLRIHGFARKTSLDHTELQKPQQLVRENTYDVIQPIYVNPTSAKDRDFMRKTTSSDKTEKPKFDPKDSPKTRFKKAALQVAKMSSMPETGKLLCLRQRHTNECRGDDKGICKLEKLPRSPAQKLDELSEIFQTLGINGRHRDKMKKENSWF